MDGVLLMDELYRSSFEHLQDELQCLDLRLALKLLQFESYATGFCNGPALNNLEIAHLLGINAQNPSQNSIPELTGRLKEKVQIKAQRWKASQAQGIDFTLPRLSNFFHLTPFEEQIVIICLAPELDRKYGRIYAYLNDDLTQKSPTIDLVFRLLSPGVAERCNARQAFAGQHPLVRYLLRIYDPSPDGNGPLLSRYLKLEDRVVSFLLGHAVVDKQLEEGVELVNPEALSGETPGASQLPDRIAVFLTTRLKNAGKSAEVRPGVVFHFYGSCGAGKRDVVMDVGQRLGMPIVVADMAKLMSSQLPLQELERLLGREAVLHQAALCLTHFDLLPGEEKANGSAVRCFMEELTAVIPILFILGRSRWQPAPPLAGCSFMVCPFFYPTVAERPALWEQLRQNQPLAAGVDLEGLAGKFKFTPGQIRNVWQLAEDLALWQNPEFPGITRKHLEQACQMLSDQTIGSLARQVDARHTWDHLVLPPDQLAQLHELVDQVQYRRKVLGEWGFERRLTLGKGLNALFTGPPGCGKTLAAEVIATALNLSLYKIDLSRVVSKYIGETEKNLAGLFEAAENANAILFFDEADALFGKRSEVKDAHDRYANIEIGYLLQKMEEFEGIGILATNLGKNMDEAFQRRMHFTVEFPFPEAVQREAIWRRIFPESAPLEEIDYVFLAEKLKLAGGNIHNIALRAAFYAAREGRGIGMRELLQAGGREYQKLGKVFLRNDFEPYYHLIGAG
jgi:hypothetical protein